MVGKIRVGIGGWSFEPWRGVFYPKGLRQKDELNHAAAQMTAIEINSTYYSTQSAKSFANWAAAAPEGFQGSAFCRTSPPGHRPHPLVVGKRDSLCNAMKK